MDYRELREVMKFLHCKGLMAKDIYADMLDTLGDSAPSYAMVKKWVTEFKKGRISTEDLVRSGRPRDVSTYENVDSIRNLIKDDERVTVQDLAKYVGISFGSVHAILSKLLEMVKVSGRWVPRRVTNERRMTRLEFCKEILAWYRVNPSRLVQQTVVDDAWIYHFERTEIFLQPPGQGDSENGDEPPETGILNKALTGELKSSRTSQELPSTGVEGSEKENGTKSDSDYAVKVEPEFEKTVEVEPKSENTFKVEPKSETTFKVEPKSETVSNDDNEVVCEEVKTDPNCAVQDMKVESTESDEKLCPEAEKLSTEALPKVEVDADSTEVSGSTDVKNPGSHSIEKVENGSDKVDSTDNKLDIVVSKENNVAKLTGDTKVANGNAPSSSVPNILAILGQRPVNGRPGVQPFIPIMGPQGVTLGQLAGGKFTNMALLAGANIAQLSNLAGANVSQLANFAGGNPLLAGTNLAHLTNASMAQLARQSNIVQGQSPGSISISPSGQKRSGPEHCPLPKKKQRSGRPPSETSCVFWDSEGVIHVETLESGKKLTGEVYCGMLNRLKESMDVKRPGALDQGVLLVEDQAPAGAKPPRGLQLLPLPVNSPDLTPSDFHIFPKVKEHVRYQQSNGLVAAIEAYLKMQEDSYFKTALTEMERRCTMCVDLNGDYVDK